MAESNALTVPAADAHLPRTLEASFSRGGWLDRAPGRYPTTVLGERAASRLGVTAPGERI
ncbi:hypothetical protein [Streptomyces sp. NPDC007984]|uniref:hypothetical protein n=1 Tax=Streptomyces sp. NPDC007984 TaxID=3364801 RepID=UPI0036E621BF